VDPSIRTGKPTWIHHEYDELPHYDPPATLRRLKNHCFFKKFKILLLPKKNKKRRTDHPISGLENIMMLYIIIKHTDGVI
jgi:hypothetical protein